MTYEEAFDNIKSANTYTRFFTVIVLICVCILFSMYYVNIRNPVIACTLLVIVWLCAIGFFLKEYAIREELRKIVLGEYDQ